MRKMRKICIGTDSMHMYMLLPALPRRSIIHLLYFFLLHVIGKCLAVTMRILG